MFENKESFLKYTISRRVAVLLRGVVISLATLLVGGCTWIVPPPFVVGGAGQAILTITDAETQPVLLIPLQGPITLPAAELSGLAWYGDTLVLLPQFPERFGGQLFGLNKAEIVAYLRGETTQPLLPRALTFDDSAVQAQITGSEGYEAIAFAGERLYLTIETRQLSGMLGYLVSGTIDPTSEAIQLDAGLLAPIEAQANLGNISDEAIFLVGDQVVTIYEANGRAVNPDPVVHLFDQQTVTPIGVIPFPQIEYRITDATALDENGRFWAINYLFPGDRNLRSYLRNRGMLAALNEEAKPIERLLEFQITSTGVERTSTAPIALALLADVAPNTWIARNWEGIVHLETPELNGFLLVTDRFPETILAFVPMPSMP